ncbi:sigma-70 family RNA polymerase sigma factor [Isoptericola halotolerans]|uniref:sigma-70 family RNA polymerase sigma factor n=1 Tax=Isoptericola halotolerans TaxID=300560 RepID=UPI00388EFB97
MSADVLAEHFESRRAHLRSVAYRVLGSTADADDAVQEAWLRAHAAGAGGVDNVGGWLTTIVARVSLNLLRSRTSRREVDWRTHVPDPLVEPIDDPEGRAVAHDEVGTALLVVLDRLAPAERVAFVLHDQFAVPFDDVALVVDRSVAATRQLASRARRKVRDEVPVQDDPPRRREVVAAYLAASQAGDFDRLLALLDPDVTARLDAGAAGRSQLRRGAADVASQAALYFGVAQFSRLVLVNGSPGLATVLAGGEVMSVLAFTVRHGRVVRIDILSDRERLRAVG